MPYTSPATVVTGTTITSAWGNSVKAGEDYLANPPACRVFRSTTQTINSGAATAISFDSESYDTDTMHSTVTNPTRITITTAGIYIITGMLQLSSDTDYLRRAVFIQIGGATTIAQTEIESATTNTTPFLTIAATYKFTAAQYFEMVAFQTNVSAGAATSTATITSVAATWVGNG